MAEVVGLVSGIIAVVELAKVTSTAIYKFSKAYKHASKDLLDLRKELVALVGVLELLKSDIEEDDDDGSTDGKDSLAVTGGPLWLCQEVLQAILDKLPKHGEKLEGLKRILWPFKDGEIKEHLAKLERVKSILELSLVAEQSVLVKEIQRLCEELQLGTSETLDTVKTIKDEQSELKGVIMSRQMSEVQHEILSWLRGNVDYEENHEEARKRHQEGTGAWFVEGSDFLDWLDRDKNLVWLYGIPGAGKTILMSTIIVTALETLSQRDDVITAYFYFSFTDEAKQKTCNMLKSVLAQLSQSISPFPEGLIGFYKRCGKRPNYSNCRELVKEIKLLCKMKKVYIFLDALDECAKDEQSDLFEALEQLSKTCKLIVTSREESDIKQALEEQTFLPVSIQSHLVDHDIRIFVKEIINKDKDIRRLTEKAKNMILQKLTYGANGMFRWVECQIAPLKKCRNTVQVTNVLAKLPNTLYETYDRILASTPEDDRDYLRRALAWIMYSKEPLNAVELAEAMVVEPGSETLDEDNRFGVLPEEVLRPFGEETEEVAHFISTIQSICGSLVRVEKEYTRIHRFSLAHYSVQEYLTSNKIASGPLSQFALDESDGNEVILESCVTYLQLNNFDDGDTPEVNEFPLYPYVCEYWHKHVIELHDPSLVTRMEKFLQLDPLSGQFQAWKRFFDYKIHYGVVGVNTSMDPAGALLHSMARLGMAAIIKELITKATPSASIVHDLLNTATAHDCVEVINVLIDIGGADVNAFDDRGYTPLHVAVDSVSHKALSVLVKRAKNLEIRTCSFGIDGDTPLEMAVMKASYSDETVLILLKAGANHSAPSDDPLLHRVAMARQVTRLRYLLEYGADIDIADEDGLTLYRKLIIASHRIKSEQRIAYDDAKSRALPDDLRESYNELEEVLEILHDGGANPQAGGPLITELEYHMALAVHEVSRSNKSHRQAALSIIESQDIVFDQRFACSDLKDTAVTYALRRGYKDLLAKMVEKGLDLKGQSIHMEDSGGSGEAVTPLVYALQHEDEDLASFLLDHGAADENWLASIPAALAGNVTELAWHRKDVQLLKQILTLLPKVTDLRNSSQSLPIVISRMLGPKVANEQDKNFYVEWMETLLENGSKINADKNLKTVVGYYNYEEWKADLLRPFLANENLDIRKSENPSWNYAKRYILVEID